MGDTAPACVRSCQTAADRGELRLVYQSAQTLRRRRPKALRSVTFPDSSAATSEQEVAGAWSRVFAEQLWGQVAESASIDRDGDVELEGGGLTRVAAVGEGDEWVPSREHTAEAILSVGSRGRVRCDMVPVELLKCSGARFLEPLSERFISAQTLLPHAWRSCLEVTVPKTKGSVEKRGVGLVKISAKVFKDLVEASQSSAGGGGLAYSDGWLRARGADRASHLSRALWRLASARGKSACALFVFVAA